MNINEFIVKLYEIMDAESSYAIKAENRLADMPLWDSLAVVSMIASLDIDFGIVVSNEDIRNCKTVFDLFLLSQNKKNV